MLDLDKPILKVSQVAEEIDLSTDRLRTYDEEKLIQPARQNNNSRLYSYNDVLWLQNLRQLISKNKLSVFGFKEILKITYFISDNDFETFIKTQESSSIWHIISEMKKNPNYNKLRKYYT